MSDKHRRLALLFWLSVAAAPLALFSLGVNEVDPDLFWHLQVARLIESDGVRPIIDAFSYNSISEPWLPYSWLAELAMLRIVESMDARSLVWIPLLCYGAMLVFLAVIVVRDAGPLKSAVVVLVSGLLVLPFIGLRPVTLAFPLCALSVWLIHHGMAGAKLRWLALAAVVPLTIVLANIHVFFLFPPLVLLVRGGPLLLTRQGDRRREGVVCVALAFVALGGSLLLNPFGTQLASVILHYMFRDVMVQTDLIDEMKPFYQMGMPVAYAASLLLLWPLVGIIKAKKWPSLVDVAAYCVALAMLLSHGRYAPLAVLLLAPLAARHGPWLGAALAKRSEPILTGMVIALVAVSVLTALTEHSPSRFDDYVEARSKYPVSAARFVADSMPHTTGRLVNEFFWGGYLSYSLWPDFQVMVDGRTQVYPEHLWRALYVDPTPASRLGEIERANADIAVFPRGFSWSELLRDSLDWRLVYEDQVSEVWVSPRMSDAMLSSLD